MIQQIIPFEQVYDEISLKRDSFRNLYESRFPTYIGLYERIVFDLTPKDFEFFMCILLETQGYTAIPATPDQDNHGIDIIATKEDITFGYQCKQWSSKYMNIKDAGGIYAKLYIAKEEYNLSHLGMISTIHLSVSSEKFLTAHLDHFWRNSDIIDMAVELKLYEEIEWQKMIHKIQYKRIGTMLAEYQQTRLGFVDLHYLRQELTRVRIHESAKHTTNFREDDDINIAMPIGKIEEISLFQYWVQ